MLVDCVQDKISVVIYYMILSGVYTLQYTWNKSGIERKYINGGVYA